MKMRVSSYISQYEKELKITYEPLPDLITISTYNDLDKEWHFYIHSEHQQPLFINGTFGTPLNTIEDLMNYYQKLKISGEGNIDSISNFISSRLIYD